MSWEPPLQGRVALVTGSTTGIGKAIAMELAKNGARLILHGRRDSEHAQQALQDVLAFGGEARFCFADFADQGERQQFSDQAWGAYGTIDILCNNAGGDVLTGKWAHRSFEEKLEYLLEVDVKASLFLSRSMGGKMRAHAVQTKDEEPGKYSIINIGWDQAWQGMEGESGEMFATTKGSIMSMTKSLAQSLAPHVRVNCIAPGWIQTSWGEQASPQWQSRAQRQSLMNRWGTPQDVAAAAAFLASNAAGFITGHILPVNGGFRYWHES